MPARKTASSGDVDSSPSPPRSPLPPPGMTPQQLQKMEELMSEVNKLKAIVLKHEVRIRDLEKLTNSDAVAPAGDDAAAGDDDLKKNGES